MFFSCCIKKMSEMGSIPMQLCDVAVPHLGFKQTIIISRPSISELSFPTCFQCFVSAADWLIISVPCQNEQCTMAGGLQAAMCARLQWSTMTEYRHGCTDLLTTAPLLCSRVDLRGGREAAGSDQRYKSENQHQPSIDSRQPTSDS